MTANELADKLHEIYTGTDYEEIKEAATMLRQQQAEIGRLKQIIDANNLNQNIGQFVKLVNEPVAWKHKPSGIIFDEIIESSEPDDLVPLYEHPMRELSDEEIMQVCSQIEPFDDTTIEQAFIEFARAILKKAREHE